MSGILSEPSMAACKSHSAMSNIKLVSGELATVSTTAKVSYGHKNHALDPMQVSCGDTQEAHADMEHHDLPPAQARVLA